MDYCEMAMEIRRRDAHRANRAVTRDRAAGRRYGRNGLRVERFTGRWPEPTKTNRERKAEWAAKFYMQESI